MKYLTLRDYDKIKQAVHKGNLYIVQSAIDDLVSDYRHSLDIDDFSVVVEMCNKFLNNLTSEPNNGLVLIEFSRLFIISYLIDVNTESYHKMIKLVADFEVFAKDKILKYIRNN